LIERAANQPIEPLTRLSEVGTTAVLDALPRAIAVTDLVGTIIGWNKAAVSVYGWPAAEALGANLLDVLAHPNDRQWGDDIFRAVLHGERWQGTFPVTRRDGSGAVVFTIVSPLIGPDGDVVGIVGAADDVTDVRDLERQASDLADHLVLALAAGDLGTWRWDADSGQTMWDETMERLFGLEAGTFDGTYDAWVALLHPDDRDEVLEALERALAERTGYVVDHRVVWPDGSVHWLQGRGMVTLDDDGRVTGTIGCTADISDRKMAEIDSERRAEHLARIAQLERRERQRLEFLGRLSQAALDAPDHHAFLRSVTRAAVPRLGDWCTVHFLPEGATAPEVVVAHADPAKVSWAEELVGRYPVDLDAPTGVGAVIRTGRPEFHPVITSQFLDQAIERSPIEPGEARAIVDTLQLTSTITVPLTTERGVVGAMQFVSAESGRTYDDSDLALAEASSGRIADALETMWLTDQQRHIATTLQEALLPPALPRVPGLDVSARYWPAGASDVGGDFYDVFRIDDTTATRRSLDRRVAVVIGDVCGTGPDAAAVTGIARHTIRAAAKHGQDEAGVLAWVDEALKYSDRGLFCSTCFATLTPEPATGRWRLRSTSGGHPLPVVVRDGHAERVGSPGTILGILDEIHSTTAEVTLQPSDTVVFYTDGLTDVRPPYGLTADQVGEMIAVASRAESAEGVAESIREQLGEVLPMSQRNDDIAMVVLRVTAGS
jgi:PAS domain S-box-containing protein